MSSHSHPATLSTRELCKESCLSRKLTSKFLWGSRVEGARDALQLSFPDNSWLSSAVRYIPADTKEEQWPGSIPAKPVVIRQGLEEHFRSSSFRDILSSCTEPPHWLALYASTYQTQPTVKDGTIPSSVPQLTKAMAAVCRTEKAHPCLFF